MSNATVDRWLRESRCWFGRYFTLDKHALLMAGLFLFVGLVSVGIMNFLQTPTSTPAPDLPESVSTTESGQASASTGVLWVIAEVAFAVLILAGIAAYRYAPTWLQNIIKDSLKAWGLILLGAFIVVNYPAATALWIVLGVIVVLNAANELDVWWLFNNALSVAIAIWLAVRLAIVFDISALLIALVGLTVYDHFFANRREWMFSMAQLMVKAKLPVLFVWPTKWRVDWDELLAGEEADTRENVGWGLGTADILLPAAVAAGVLTAPQSGLVAGGQAVALLVILGAVVAAFRLRHEMLTTGSGAGLPAITAGVAGGLLVGQVVVLV